MIAALPAAIREEIDALNLERRSLADLSARVILLHGRDDTIIPFGESRALAAALPDERVDLYLVDSMSHVDLGPAGLDDTFTFWRAIYRLLEERDRA